MTSDYEEYEKESNAIREINNAYLTGFEKWLKNKGLAEKTIKNHVMNVDFYINDFLCYYDMQDVRQGCYSIGSFLGSWFIRKAAWSSCAHIKSNAASIKKFYGFMLENNIVEQEDYDGLCEDIKEEMPDWLDEMKDYEEMLFEDF